MLLSKILRPHFVGSSCSRPQKFWNDAQLCPNATIDRPASVTKEEEDLIEGHYDVDVRVVGTTVVIEHWSIKIESSRPTEASCTYLARGIPAYLAIGEELDMILSKQLEIEVVPKTGILPPSQKNAVEVVQWASAAGDVIVKVVRNRNWLNELQRGKTFSGCCCSEAVSTASSRCSAISNGPRASSTCPAYQSCNQSIW